MPEFKLGGGVSGRELQGEADSGGTITQRTCCAICGIVLCSLVAIMSVNPWALMPQVQPVSLFSVRFESHGSAPREFIRTHQ